MVTEAQGNRGETVPRRIIKDMLLSDTAMLVFVLRRSGCVGRLTSGRIERVGPNKINVYTNPGGTINEYISGSNLRSWCVLGPDRNPLPGWQQIGPEDASRIESASEKVFRHLL